LGEHAEINPAAPVMIAVTAINFRATRFFIDRIINGG
jgi:hypothetical protein